MYRKIRKTLGVLLIVSAIILTQIPYPKAKAYQADFKMDGTTLVRYTGTAETVSVPASVEVIGEEAFADNAFITNIQLGKDVKEIAYNAFSGCKGLTSIEIPDSVEIIGNAAFSNCTNLKDVKIGGGLEELGTAVFAGCENLEEISIASENFVCDKSIIYDAKKEVVYEMLPGRMANTYNMPSTVIDIKPYAFWGCNNLQTVTLSENLNNIPAYTFSNCVSLKTVEIPYSVGRIHMKAFENCVNLQAITVPLSVQFIHDTAFDGCGNFKVNAVEESYADKYFKDRNITNISKAEYEDIQSVIMQNALTQEEVDALKEAEKEAEKEAANKENSQPSQEEGDLWGKTYIVGNNAVVFIDNTEQIVYSGPKTEEETEEPEKPETDDTEKKPDIIITTDIKGVSFPKYTIINDTIANQAYYLNDGLTEYYIPPTVTKIGTLSFARSALASINIPQGVTAIGYGAFYHCDYLGEITIPDSVTQIGPYAFANTKWLNDWYKYSTDKFLIVGDGILLAYKGEKKNVVIPDEVKHIAPQAFMNHTEIVAVDLGNGVMTIGDEAFMGCTGLDTIKGGSAITQIGDRAYMGCPLSVARVQSDVHSVGLKAFSLNPDVNDAMVVFQGTSLPVITYGEDAKRLSNYEHRDNAFDNVGLALISNSITSNYYQGTVLDPNEYGFHGLSLSIKTYADGKTPGTVELRLCTLYPDSDGKVVIPETYTIYGKPYKLLSIDQDAFMYYKYNVGWLANKPVAIELPNAFVNEAALLLDNVILNDGSDNNVTSYDKKAVNVITNSNSLKNQEVISANINGLNENLTLTIRESDEVSDDIKNAYTKLYGDTQFNNVVGLDLTLKTAGDVLITKLGSTEMSVIIPVPISTNYDRIHMLCLDANGQPESVPFEIVDVEGQRCISFKVKHCSPYGVYEFKEGTDNPTGTGELDASPDTGDYSNPMLYLEIGMILFGLFLILYKGRKRNFRRIGHTI